MFDGRIRTPDINGVRSSKITANVLFVSIFVHLHFFFCSLLTAKAASTGSKTAFWGGTVAGWRVTGRSTVHLQKVIFWEYILAAILQRTPPINESYIICFYFCTRSLLFL
jgi:hypothetical protein